ncbi:MAG: ABC transporter permease [Candidatus Jettenia caeni]|nr:MAG: ABC transporter permease [Candidatus Jettenia caeni]GJQ46546.1 MAG: ABC transporter permease [Candidatus Jettenia caeni]
MFFSPYLIRRIIKQIYFIGVKSTSVVVLTGSFTGMVLALQTYYALVKFGAETSLGPVVALSLIRELGPVISALMVTGCAGSALTAEIGIMRITEQIDALDAMALNPYKYLIIPNLLAGIISLPLLNAIFVVVGIFGGYAVGVGLMSISGGTYFGGIRDFVTMKDIIEGFYKSLSFGILITWIGCYKGYFTGYGAEGVSKATTQAVVLSSVMILVWDYFMTSLLVA